LIQASSKLSFQKETNILQKPIYYIVVNLPVGNEYIDSDNLLEAELSHESCKVLAHEIGHSFHSVLSSTPYQFVSFDFDTDYSEIAAHIFEKLVFQPSTIQLYIDKFAKNKKEFGLVYEEYLHLYAVLDPWRRLEQLFYAYLDFKFHTMSKDTVSEEDLYRIYNEGVSKIYGDIDKSFGGLDTRNTSWFVNMEPLGNTGGIYYAYIFAAVMSKNALKKKNEMNLKAIFSQGHEEEIGDVLFSYLYDGTNKADTV